MRCPWLVTFKLLVNNCLSYRIPHLLSHLWHCHLRLLFYLRGTRDSLPLADDHLVHLGCLLVFFGSLLLFIVFIFVVHTPHGFFKGSLHFFLGFFFGFGEDFVCLGIVGASGLLGLLFRLGFWVGLGFSFSLYLSRFFLGFFFISIILLGSILKLLLEHINCLLLEVTCCNLASQLLTS